VGQHASARPQDFIFKESPIDYCILGECEEGVSKLIKYLEKGSNVNKIENLLKGSLEPNYRKALESERSSLRLQYSMKKIVVKNNYETSFEAEEKLILRFMLTVVFVICVINLTGIHTSFHPADIYFWFFLGAMVNKKLENPMPVHQASAN